MSYCRKCAHWIENRPTCPECNEIDRLPVVEAENKRLRVAVEMGVSPKSVSIKGSGLVVLEANSEEG